jgi:hypothetical protein
VPPFSSEGGLYTVHRGEGKVERERIKWARERGESLYMKHVTETSYQGKGRMATATCYSNCIFHTWSKLHATDREIIASAGR